MKKINWCIYLPLVFLLFFKNADGQVMKDYQEAPDPHPDENADWKVVLKGVQSSFANPLLKFAKTAIPSISPKQSWSVRGWKGERVFTQIILWSAQATDKVSFKFTNFVSAGKNTIPATVAKAQFVRYVLTDEFGGGCDTRKPEDFSVSLVADVIDNLTEINISAHTTRPVWVSVNIPATAQAGIYQSTLKMFVKNKFYKDFKITIEVLNNILPKPADWQFYLDMWQNPYSVARYHNVKVWSPQHWALLKPLMQMLAGAGQKTITTTLNNRAWGTQTEDPYESMVVWNKKADGTWAYDYTIFDNWVTFMMGLGIKQQINCYSLIPWGNEFYYNDVIAGKEVKVMAEPGTKEYAELITPFLLNFKTHLIQKGWDKITRLAMDERNPEQMKAMLALLNNVTPGFAISLADDHKTYKIYPDQLKDLSVSFGSTIDKEDLEYRKQHKMISTFYVCCVQSFPNIHTFSLPAEGVYIGWYAMATNLDGFLFWAYNNWVKDPLVDSRFRTWPAGDTYTIYPEARSSIRFEMLRDGIEDAEKIRLLRTKFTADNNQDKLKKLNTLVATFDKVTKPGNLDEMVEDAQNILNDLSK
jgi:Domain of unknown function (DUF4091)